MARRTRKPRLPQGIFQAEVTELLTDGRGLAKVDDKAVMIGGALPGETVSFEYKSKKKQFLQGQVVEILKASPDRVVPECEFFNSCGGCALQHLRAEKQIEFKQKQILNNIKKQAGVEVENPEPAISEENFGYRRKARLGIKHVEKKGRVLVGFRERYAPYIVEMTSCKVLAKEISDLIMPISELVGQLSTPDRIPQVEVALGDTCLALNFRHLDELTENDLELFDKFGKDNNANIYLQSGNETTVKGLNHNKIITYFIEGKKSKIVMDFMPYHFTQVNFKVNKRMIEQAINWLDLQEEDEVLDLFCGLGNFSLPMAQCVKSVVGIEGDKSLVDWATKNAQNNNIENVKYHKVDLTKDTSLMAWRSQKYNKVLIDPPRSGAFEIMPLIGKDIRPEKILYISCHPATLARDINELINKYGYKLIKVGAIDMFSHTAHVESMALLELK